MRHYPSIFIALPAHYLDAVLAFAERGLGMQEQFSLKSTIELLVSCSVPRWNGTCSEVLTHPSFFENSTAPLGSTNEDGFLIVLGICLNLDTTRPVSRPINSHCGRRGSSSIASRFTFRTSPRLSLANARTSSTSSQGTIEHSQLAEREDN